MSTYSSERNILLVLAAVNFTHIIDFMIMMPLGNFLMPHFGITTQAFTVLVSSYAIAAGCSSFFSAFYVNTFDRKKVLLFSYIGFLVGTVACGFAPTYWVLLVARVIAGLFGGLISAQVISIIADLVPFERRGKAMGITMGAFSMASIVGVPFALYLANKINWQAPFIMVGLLGCILIPIILLVVPSMKGHLDNKITHPKLDVIKSIINDKRQQVALLFSGLMMMGHFMIIPFINPFLEFNIGFERSFSPLVYLFGGIASLISANIVGRLADIYGKWRVYMYCVIGCIPLVIFITNMPLIPKALVLCVFAIWFALSTGRGLAAQALVSNVSSAETRGSFQSFVSFLNQIGTGVASIVAGAIVVLGPTGKLIGYPTLGVVSVIVLVATVWLGQMIFKEL